MGTYAYGALGYDYNSPGPMGGSKGGSAVPRICKKCQKWSSTKMPKICKKCKKLMGGGNVLSKKTNQKTKYNKKKKKSIVKNVDSKKTKKGKKVNPERKVPPPNKVQFDLSNTYF